MERHMTWVKFYDKQTNENLEPENSLTSSELTSEMDTYAG
jgi:hypothetical protein